MADALARHGPSCVVCHSPATLYCRQDDAFLCAVCDVHVHSTSILLSQHDRLPTSVVWSAGDATSGSDASAGAIFGAALELPRYNPAAAPPAPAAHPLFPSCLVARAPAHASPFSFGGPCGLQPPPPLPRIGANLGSPAPPLQVTSGATLDAELMDCLEGLCTDPLAPLDFGYYDLGQINTGSAVDLAALDGCLECGAGVGECNCTQAAAATAARGAAFDASARSDCSTASRPGSSQLSPVSNVGTGTSAGHAKALEGDARRRASCAARGGRAGDSEDVHGDAAPQQQQQQEMQQPRQQQEEQQRRQEGQQRQQQQRKRAADAAPEAAPPPPRSLRRPESDGTAALAALLSRRWGSSGAVVTTGMSGVGSMRSAGSGALPPGLSAALSLNPATPTADHALAPTMGSFIWQQSQQASLPTGAGAVVSTGLRCPGAGAGAVTTGAAEAAAALQRHASAVVTSEPGVKVSVRVAPPLARPAPAGTPQGGAKPAPAKPTPAAKLTPDAKPTPGPARAARGAARRSVSAAAGPAADAAGAAAEGAADNGQHELPPIPPYRDGESRADKLARYRAKRERRRFKKTVRYECRKHYADLRPRIKGRFVSPEEFAAWQEQQQAEAPAAVAVTAC